MSDRLAQKIQETSDRKLTERQKTFARLIVEGTYSNTECARRAGFAVPNQKASVLLNGKDFPHVVEYIKELREERERKYGVTLVGQLQRLTELSKGAEEAGQFSAAINAEKIRSALGGLTIDRRENINRLDDMSRADIVARLAELQKKYPHAFIEGEYKDVTRAGSELLEHNQETTTTELPILENREQSRIGDT